MRLFSMLILAALSLLAARPAEAGPLVRVTITPISSGVEAVFTLPEPTRSAAFTDAAEAVRSDAWHVQTPGIELKKGVVARVDGAAFDRFVMRITPDTQARDRTYPGLTRIGQGWQIYGPYLLIKGIETRAHIALPRRWTTAPSEPADFDPAGYVFVGPQTYVARGQSLVVSPPEVSPALRRAVVASADRATATYTERLGMKLDVRPTLIIARVPSIGGSFQGDTTDGPVVSVRFFGDGPQASGPEGVASVDRFLRHEYFHLWNAWLAHSRDGDREAWLHEGMAEYAALITSATDDPRNEPNLRGELAQRLAGCARRLKKGLMADPPTSGSGVYDCGVVAEWAADLDARTRGQDIFAVWKDLFRPHEFDAAALLAASATRRADDPLKLLLDPAGPLDWSAIVAGLTARGAAITPSRDGPQDRSALVMHLERHVCRDGSIGFWLNKDSIKLDTGSRCGVLNGDPEVDAVAGINIMAAPSKAFDAVAALCASKASVVLARRTVDVAHIVCRQPLKPPMVWAVTKAW